MSLSLRIVKNSLMLILKNIVNSFKIFKEDALISLLDEFVIFDDVLFDAEVGELHRKGLDGVGVCGTTNQLL